MKTFEEAMAKFRDCSNDERDPYSSIVQEAGQSEITLQLLATMSASLGDSGAALIAAFMTGLMVGIEMEKEDT